MARLCRALQYCVEIELAAMKKLEVLSQGNGSTKVVFREDRWKVVYRYKGWESG